MSALPDYTVGGTIHLVVNNQAGARRGGVLLPCLAASCRFLWASKFTVLLADCDLHALKLAAREELRARMEVCHGMPGRDRVRKVLPATSIKQEDCRGKTAVRACAGGVHHRPAQEPLQLVLHRRGQGAQRAHLPRQRRRRGGAAPAPLRVGAGAARVLMLDACCWVVSWVVASWPTRCPRAWPCARVGRAFRAMDTIDMH